VTELGLLPARSNAPHFLREFAGIESNAAEHQCVPVRWIPTFAGRREERAALTRAWKSFTFQTALEPKHAFAISPRIPREVCHQIPAL
jgi:hypothetical protein